jgi:hypothetical protein
VTLPPWYISDIDGVDLRPDPDTITTVAQLQYAMRQYRVWAGNPSFHTLSQRCRNRVSASSLCQALTSDDLPPLKVVRDFIGACGATREYRDRFERTWRRLSLST